MDIFLKYHTETKQGDTYVFTCIKDLWEVKGKDRGDTENLARYYFAQCYFEDEYK